MKKKPTIEQMKKRPTLWMTWLGNVYLSMPNGKVEVCTESDDCFRNAKLEHNFLASDHYEFLGWL